MPDINSAFFLPRDSRHSPTYATDFIFDVSRTISVKSEV
jgi:hypothetical protein